MVFSEPRITVGLFLTHDQARIIHQRLQPMVGYLLLLRERMEQRGFDPNDKLYLMAKRSYDALHELFIETHYLSCDKVGWEPR